MRLTKVLEMVERRKRIILQTVFLVILVFLVASYVVTPTYESSSKILIAKAQGKGVATGTNESSHGLAILTKGHDLDVNKALGVSRPYIDKMAFKLQLRDDHGEMMTAEQLVRHGIVAAIKERLFPGPTIRIRQYEETDMLQVAAISPDAEEAMMMANTLASIMVDQNQAQVRAQYRHAREFLEGQIRKVREDYNKDLQKVAGLEKRYKVVDLKAETKLATENMAKLLKEKQDNVFDLAQARARLSSLKDHLGRQNPEFVSASTLKENPHISVLKKNLTQLRLELAQASSELTQEHPRIMALRERINRAESELGEEIEVYRTSAPELVSLDGQIHALEARLEGVDAEIDKNLKSIEGLSDRILKQANLDMELKAMPKAYSSLLDSLYENGMAEAKTLSEIRVVEPAVKPLRPAWPNKTANAAAGVIMGLVFGLCLAFIREYRDDTIKTVEDVEFLRPTVFIGAVPRLKEYETPLISARDPNDPLCESYRRIRTHLNLMEHVQGRPLHSVLITSASPGEGKSTTVANLGISFACEEKRVLIVDMDLRRPRMHTYFDVPNDIGVTDVLQGACSLDKTIQPTGIPGLSIIPSGLPYPDPGALIESEKAGESISRMRARFDLVILDAAPLLVKSDPLALGRHVDGFVAVLESEKTTRRAVLELKDMLAKAGMRPLGFVVNKYPVQKGRYFHEYSYGDHGRQLPSETGRRAVEMV